MVFNKRGTIRKGARAPLKSGACPILRYRYGLGKPLTSTPPFKKAIIGLSPKALLFYYSFWKWAETTIFY
jgi:hypothetical protein